MPLYDYMCRKCGPFREWQSMAAASDPCACPTCRRRSARTMSAPHLRASPATARYRAEERNERSANEPRVMQSSGGDRARHGHHGHSHDHGGRGQWQRSGHPWMIGH
ncbi:MAG: FmdB family zinc ribbon protein [Alphaproteobacteria bacterium]